jgi:hypothetical protein
MEFTSVVLYRKQLVYYNIFSKDGWTYTARLLGCKELTPPLPPFEVHLYKEGLCWRGSTDEDLLNCLGFEIDRKLPLVLKEESYVATDQQPWV